MQIMFCRVCTGTKLASAWHVQAILSNRQYMSVFVRLAGAEV